MFFCFFCYNNLIRRVKGYGLNVGYKEGACILAYRPMKKENLPNVISVTRIMLTLLLFFIMPLSPLFFIIYFLCGLSDALDGYIARKEKLESRLGETLDSIADSVFIGSLLIILVPLMHVPFWGVLWIIGIAGVRIVSLIIGFFRYHTFTFLHTYANKLTGLFIFCFPLFYWGFGTNLTVWLIGSVATISAIEEMIINLTSKELSRNVKSIFTKNKKN